jgi:hypothetical protein
MQIIMGVVRRLVNASVKPLYRPNSTEIVPYAGENKVVFCGPEGSGRWHKVLETIQGHRVLTMELPPLTLKDHVPDLKLYKLDAEIDFVAKCMPNGSVLAVRNIELLKTGTLCTLANSGINIVGTSNFDSVDRLEENGYDCRAMKKWSYYDFELMTRGYVVGDIGPYRRAGEIAGTPGFYINAVDNPDPNYSLLFKKAIEASKQWPK